MNINFTSQLEKYAILHALHRKGYKWGTGHELTGPMGSSTFETARSGRLIIGDKSVMWGGALVADGYKNFETLLEDSITVGDYPVEFKKDGIQVGCTFVPTKTVKQINDRLQAGDWIDPRVNPVTLVDSTEYEVRKSDGSVIIQRGPTSIWAGARDAVAYRKLHR